MNSIFLDLEPSSLSIQGLRLWQALMESNFEIRIPARFDGEFTPLRERFHVQYALGRGNAKVLGGVHCSHREPSTVVGAIRRSLIYPHAILEHCRDLWSGRDVAFHFTGLMTEKRKKTLETWRERNGTVDIRLYPSDRGRTFPYKAWDDAYYEGFARSRFVLCPDGDFAWSYRFVEALLCGAMPVVENLHSMYEGFHCHTFRDRALELRWDKELAEHNFTLAWERLTVAKDELNSELENLLGQHG